MPIKVGDLIITSRGVSAVVQTDVCCGPGLIFECANVVTGDRFLIGQHEMTPFVVELDADNQPTTSVISRAFRYLRELIYGAPARHR